MEQTLSEDSIEIEINGDKLSKKDVSKLVKANGPSVSVTPNTEGRVVVVLSLKNGEVFDDLAVSTNALKKILVTIVNADGTSQIAVSYSVLYT